ncbi:MAG: hypothetical protein JXN65_01225 [Clostridia bacterium]|nr:hypothetical protein [Clostridia bacterium]
MIFTKDGLIRLLVTIIISVFICVLITAIFFAGQMEALFLIKSVILGCAIWFIAELSFDFIDKLWPHKIFPSYAALCIIILAGTTGGLLLFEVNSFAAILIADAIALFCGLAIAIVNRKIYEKKLNSHLKEFKDKKD